MNLQVQAEMKKCVLRGDEQTEMRLVLLEELQETYVADDEWMSNMIFCFSFVCFVLGALFFFAKCFQTLAFFCKIEEERERTGMVELKSVFIVWFCSTNCVEVPLHARRWDDNFAHVTSRLHEHTNKKGNQNQMCLLDARETTHKVRLVCLLFLNLTMPFAKAKSVWSFPIPT